MQRYADVVLDKFGKAVQGASVLVKTIAGVPVTVYGSNGGVAIDNPIATDSLGRFAFYAADGRYTIEVSIGGVLYTTVPDILLEDPADANTVNINGGAIANVALTNITIDGGAPVSQAALDTVDAKADQAIQTANEANANLTSAQQDAQAALDAANAAQSSADAAQATADAAVPTADLAAPGGALKSGYTAGTTNAVATDLQTKGREVKSLLDWMTAAQRTIVQTGVGYDATTRAAMYAAISNAWTDALAGGFDLAAPAGIYDTGENSFPWRNPVSTSLLDCKGITIWCAGSATVFQTTSTNGADVFQLNALKNFSVRGFPTITGTISGSADGSNGVSVTNGWENLYLEIDCRNLPSLDKISHVDGGKALTLQPSTTANVCGRIRAVVMADGCSEGFGYEPDLATSAGKTTQIDVEVHARNCYIAAKAVAAAATGPLSASMTMGVNIRGSAVDCQHDLLLQRMHGISAVMETISTKTAAAKRLSPSGVAWFASDTVVDSFQSIYTKNARVNVHGSKGECDYKAQIGGAAAGSSGLIGRTEDGVFELDIGGTSAIADINAVDSGGNTMANCELRISAVTASSFPSEFTAAGANNRLRRTPYYSGTFTASLTGCSDATAPSGTVKYTVVDDLVMLSLPSITGTSNTISASLTGMPADLYPSVLQGDIGITTDNGVSGFARLNINTNGVIDLYVNASSATFLNSGTKGVQFCNVHYKRG